MITSGTVNCRRCIRNTVLGLVLPLRKDTLVWGDRCGGGRERRGLLARKIMK